ncbi:MAG: hypothetical protein HC933_14825 [Pleurocapsa sp. SU_196_0]|nr:hypothetical protein [Pleurocapsa sp. SU_196_0]
MNRLWQGIVAALILSGVILSGVALAESPVKHTETLRVGPYTVQVFFSEFPIRAERSLDLTFKPEGGLAGKTATWKLIHPDGSSRQAQARPLPRFPRDRTLWGFDSLALPTQGDWQLELALNGASGSGTTRLPLAVLERPAGPPSDLILFLATIPLLALFVVAVRAWVRVQPLRRLESRQW